MKQSLAFSREHDESFPFHPYHFASGSESSDMIDLQGSDDQGFYALAAMSAAERNLGWPSNARHPKEWQDHARLVFESQVTRWDMTSCGGGLKWQLDSLNSGYNYKNAVSQGVFFQLAARLARFYGNQTYADWAERVWSWSRDVGIISDDYAIYDGTDDTTDCSQINRIRWSANAGLFLYGSAVMYNIVSASMQNTS